MVSSCCPCNLIASSQLSFLARFSLWRFCPCCQPHTPGLFWRGVSWRGVVRFGLTRLGLCGLWPVACGVWRVATFRERMTMTKQQMARVVGHTVKPWSNHKKHCEITKNTVKPPENNGQTTKTTRNNSDPLFFYFDAAFSRSRTM